jgi:hypothetical protein
MRPAILQQALESAYGDVLTVVARARSTAELEQALARFPITGATHRKSLSFLLNACSYARLPISPALTGRLRTSYVKKPANGDPPVETTTISIPLRSGGTLTLSGRFNPFELSAADRQFVFRLVDQLHTYQQDLRPAASTADEEEEAPF